MGEDDKDFFRCAVNMGGTRTSVSMDGLLASFMIGRLGGEDSLRSWVRETAERLDREWAASAAKAVLGERVRANTGVSRAIQREVLIYLLGEPPMRQ